MKMHGGFKIEAQATDGAKWGSVPGHQYHDIEVGMGHHGSMYRCVVVEAWGCRQEQGRGQEEGRRKVVARDEDWRLALEYAHQRAGALDMRADYLGAAIDQVHEQMLDVVGRGGEA